MQTIADQFANRVIPGSLDTVDGLSFEELAERYGAVVKSSNGVRVYVFADNSSVALAFNNMEVK